MFRNRSKRLVVLLVLLAAITLIFGTAVGSPSNAPSGMDLTAAAKSSSQGYIALKEAQLEQRDAIQLGVIFPVISNGSIGNDSPDELRRQQILDRREFLHPSAAKSPFQDYFALKSAQLEQRDAIQFGASAPVISNGTLGSDSPDELRRQQILDRREFLHPSAACLPLVLNGQLQPC